MTTNYSGPIYPLYPPDAVIAQNLSQTTAYYGATTTANNLNGVVPLVVRTQPITTDLSIFSGNWTADSTSRLADGQGVNGYTPVGWFNFINASYTVSASIPCINFGTSFSITPTSEVYSGGCRIAWMGANFTGNSGQNKAEFYLPGGNGARIRLNAGSYGTAGNVVIGEEVSLNNTGYGQEDTTYALRVAGSGSFTSQSASTPVLNLQGAYSQSAPVIEVNSGNFTVSASGSLKASGLRCGVISFSPYIQMGGGTVSSFTTTIDNSTIFTSGNATINLVTAVGNGGVEQTIIKTDTGTTTTLVPVSGQTINGNTSMIITTQYTSLSLISDNSNWFIK